MTTRDAARKESAHEDIAVMLRVLSPFKYSRPSFKVSWLKKLWAEWQGAQAEIARLKQELGAKNEASRG